MRKLSLSCSNPTSELHFGLHISYFPGTCWPSLQQEWWKGALQERGLSKAVSLRHAPTFPVGTVYLHVGPLGWCRWLLALISCRVLKTVSFSPGEWGETPTNIFPGLPMT